MSVIFCHIVRWLVLFFSWEPALETPNSRAAGAGVKKKPLQFSTITANFEHRDENKTCSACRE